ncbi:hypothetical protein GJ496_004614 [Pomphorhynchus laevis]|nr:hypothetical protein GJ496_004614 [Pomphorhynchus laevis]
MFLLVLVLYIIALTTPTSYGFDFKCMQPKDPGPCKASMRRYYFDQESNKCMPFTYGGCQGNDNNFNTRSECRSTCERTISTEDNSAPGGGFHCREPVDPGPCMAAIRRYAYDYKTDSCKSFIYGGCQGNKNNFETKQQCEQACATRHDNDSTNQGGSGGFKCMLPKDEGPCRGEERRWYFDSGSNKCRRFTYGGCQGNENNFKTKSECEQNCASNSGGVDPPIEIPGIGGGFHCREPVDPGPCMAAIRRYAYDYKTDSCKSFIYGGCQGNKNNFETKQQCEQACATRHDNDSTNQGGSGGFKCMLPKDEGPCRGEERRWYFDSGSNKCRRFTYGGCQVVEAIVILNIQRLISPVW